MAKVLADHGWMVVTGAGPGIMAAGMEGAGRDMSFGVTIRLPFENEPNPVIAGDEKLVSMKYFFTRKLMLIKESRASCACPAASARSTRRSSCSPSCRPARRRRRRSCCSTSRTAPTGRTGASSSIDELAGAELIAPADVDLFLVTDDVEAACDEIVGFYSNYHSMRSSVTGW